MPQTSYTSKPSAARAGQIATSINQCQIVSYACATAAGIEAGIAVCRDSTSSQTGGKAARLVANATDVQRIVGFTMFQFSKEPTTPHYLGAGGVNSRMMSVVRKGPMWLPSVDDCSGLSSQVPYICNSGANAGKIQAASSGGTQHPGVAVVEGGATLSLCEVNIPVAANASNTTEQTDEWTNPAASDAAGLLVATASSVAVQTKLTAALIAGGLAALAAYPRNVTFTTAGGTAADAPASATIVGTDIDGNALSETVTIAQTATIAQGVKAFRTITSITYTAGDGAGATVSIGFGSKFGLSRTIKSAAGIPDVLQEIAIGVVVSTGTYVDGTTSAPHGTYSPASAPDGAKDYALTYVVA